MLKIEVVLERYRWRFFSKPAGLELAFLNTRNLPLLSFFIFFYFDFQIHLLLDNRGSIEVWSCRKGYKIPERILYSFFGLVLWVPEFVFSAQVVSFSKYVVN